MSTTKKKNQSNDVHFLQKFEAVKIHRSQINFAKYNPRVWEKANEDRLNSNLKTVGLIEAVVWNKVTGNLVGGHKRLSKLDAAWEKKYENLDYWLTVAKVEMDEKTEKEQNIFLNNHNAQGEYDVELMKPLMLEIDTKAAGFSLENLEMMGIEMDLDNHQNEAVENVIDTFEAMKSESKAEKQAIREAEANNPDAEPKKDWKEVKKGIADKYEAESKEADNYVTISFSNHANKAAFMERFGKEADDKFIKGEIFSKQIERID